MLTSKIFFFQGADVYILIKKAEEPLHKALVPLEYVPTFRSLLFETESTGLKRRSSWAALHQVWQLKLARDCCFTSETATASTCAPLPSNPWVWAARKLGSTISAHLNMTGWCVWLINGRKWSNGWLLMWKNKGGRESSGGEEKGKIEREREIKWPTWPIPI